MGAEWYLLVSCDRHRPHDLKLGRRYKRVEVQAHHRSESLPQRQVGLHEPADKSG